jgi:hypothetical protein
MVHNKQVTLRYLVLHMRPTRAVIERNRALTISLSCLTHFVRFHYREYDRGCNHNSAMAEKIYTIVADYDTVIVLRNPLVDFAVWDPPENDSSSPDGLNTCLTSSTRPVPNENKIPRRSTRIQHLGNISHLIAGAKPTAHTTNPSPGSQAMEIDTEISDKLMAPCLWTRVILYISRPR